MNGKTIGIRVLALFALTTWLVLPATAHAEVMDKEPSIIAIWLWAVVGSSVGWFIGRRWPWAMIATLTAGLFLPVSMLMEIGDLNGAVQREAGFGYVAQVCVALLLVVGGHALALVQRGRLRSVV